MRKMLSFTAAAALLLAPSMALAVSQHKEDKLAKLEAKADAISARQDAIQKKAGNSPTPAQQAKLDKLSMRADKVAAAEQKVEDRIPASK